MNDNKGQTVFLSVIGIATLLVAIIGATFAYFSLQVTGNDNASSIFVKTAVLGSIVFTDGNEIAPTEKVNLQNDTSWETLTDTANPAKGSQNNVWEKTFTVANNASGNLTNAVTYYIYFVDNSTTVSGTALSANSQAQAAVKFRLDGTVETGGSGSIDLEFDDTDTALYNNSSVKSATVASGSNNFKQSGTAYLIGKGTFAANSDAETHTWKFTFGILNSTSTQDDLQGATINGYLQVVDTDVTASK